MNRLTRIARAVIGWVNTDNWFMCWVCYDTGAMIGDSATGNYRWALVAGLNAVLMILLCVWIRQKRLFLS